MRNLRTLASLSRSGLLVACVALTAACASGGSGYAEGEQENPPTMVEVTNQYFGPVHVYAVKESQQYSLGILSNGATQEYTLPRDFVFIPRLIRFRADLIGEGRSVFSDEIYVNPGDFIEWRIENQANLFNISVRPPRAP